MDKATIYVVMLMIMTTTTRRFNRIWRKVPGRRNIPKVQRWRQTRSVANRDKAAGRRLCAYTTIIYFPSNMSHLSHSPPRLHVSEVVDQGLPTRVSQYVGCAPFFF